MSVLALNEYDPDYVAAASEQPEYDPRAGHDDTAAKYSADSQQPAQLRKYSRRELIYYADYDPIIGYRIAVTLGLLILLFIVFVLYKTHCAAKRNQRLIMKASAAAAATTSTDNTTTTTTTTTMTTTTTAMKTSTVLATTTTTTSAGHRPTATSTQFIEAAPVPLRTNIYKPKSKQTKSQRTLKRSLQTIV